MNTSHLPTSYLIQFVMLSFDKFKRPIAYRKSLNLLDISLKKIKQQNNQSTYGSCNLCQRDYIEILHDKQNLIVIDCKHIMCQICHFSLIESQEKHMDKICCPICKKQNKSAIICSKRNSCVTSDEIQLEITGVKRFDIDFYDNLQCQGSYDCMRNAILSCDICHDQTYQSCGSCCSFNNDLYINQYQYTLFYCGCKFEGLEICLKLGNNNDIKQFELDYGVMFQDHYQRASTSQIEIDKKSAELLHCNFCQNFSHKEKKQINNHIRENHALFAIKHGYASYLCLMCEKSFQYQYNFEKHICKKKEASLKFSNKMLYETVPNQDTNMDQYQNKNIMQITQEVDQLSQTTLQNPKIRK